MKTQIVLAITVAALGMTMPSFAEDASDIRPLVVFDRGGKVLLPNAQDTIRDETVVVTNHTELQLIVRDFRVYTRSLRIDAGSVLRASYGSLYGPGYASGLRGVGGTYGGRGWPGHPDAYPTPASRDPYGTADELDIAPGANGTSGWPRDYSTIVDIVTLPGGPGGGGGGALTIEAERVELYGTVHADGTGGRAGFSGYDEVRRYWVASGTGMGGSGGGILILARELVLGASAVIRANGGLFDKEVLTYEGYRNPPHTMLTGGGGRIKIFYERADIAPTAVIEAKGYEDGTVHLQQVRNIAPLAVQALGMKSIFIDEVADLNGDGTVNHQDLLLLQSQWQKTVPSGTP